MGMFNLRGWAIPGKKQFLLILLPLLLLGSLSAALDVSAQITEIIDATGDGAGNPLFSPFDIAVDGSGNVYVTGLGTDNAFKITPAGGITEIIDFTGDGAGNTFDGGIEIAVDGSGNVYVTGQSSMNAFKITPAGGITEIIDATGDGAGNPLDGAFGIAVDGSGNVYVTGASSDNAFKIAGQPDLTISKTNNVGGATTLGNDWTWTLTGSNGGNATATFTVGQTIVSDNLPNANIGYSPTSFNATNTGTTTGTIACKHRRQL